MVISSHVTGSGYDRIEHGKNGYIFPAGDVKALARQIKLVIEESDERLQMGQIASRWHKTVKPMDNAKFLISLGSVYR